MTRPRLTRSTRTLAILGAALALTACGQTNVQQTDAVVLYQDIQCDSTTAEPTARWIQDQGGLELAYERLQGPRLGAPNKVPTVDFGEFGVLLIEMGQEPTGGYALHTGEEGMTVEGATAILRIEWQTPEPGAIVTQILTSPCLMLAIPRGDYSRLVVLDQDGTAHFELDIARGDDIASR